MNSSLVMTPSPSLSSSAIISCHHEIVIRIYNYTISHFLHLDLFHGPRVAQSHHHAHQLLRTDHSEYRILVFTVAGHLDILPIVVGVKHFKCLLNIIILNVIIELILSALFLH